jgi:adenylate kinase
MSPFDFINAISHTKVDLIRTADDPASAEKSYNSFIVNRGLAYYPDTVLYANEMNICNNIDSKLKNDYLINIIRSKKRFSKWAKRVSVDDLELIKSYYGYTDNVASQVLSILSADQLKIIRQKQEQGGVK